MTAQGKIPVVIQVSRIKESFVDRSLVEIQGCRAIDYLICRIKKNYGDNIILATSSREEDHIYEEIARENNIDVYRGDYKNVISRLLGAASQLHAANFIRIYANYPLVDIEQMKKLAERHEKERYEYSYNEHNEGVIWGTGCEVFSVNLLRRLEQLQLKESQQETVGYYVRQNDNVYRVLRYCINKKRPNYKVCIESYNDLELVRDIAGHVEMINNSGIKMYLDSHGILGAYNQKMPAKEVGLEKLFLHPKKLQQLLSSGEMDYSYPISVELSLTNVCNLSCVYCSDYGLRTQQGMKTQLTKENLFAMFDDLATGGTEGIVLEGGGEPTIYPYFTDIVKYAKSVGLAVGLITNGTQMLEESVLREMEWIRVSLDATTKEEYIALKGIDCFEQVFVNLSYYVKYCETVGVGFVVTKNNISQVENLVLRLRELQVSYIQFRPVVDCPELYPTDLQLDYLKCYETPDFAIEVDGMRENAAGGNGELPCMAHSITTVISADGSVYLCGRLNIYDWIPPIGNITCQTFADVWRSEERRRQMEMVMNTEFCRDNCPQCRVSKFNQLLYRLAKTKSKHFI